jgi:hypothetical protein
MTWSVKSRHLLPIAAIEGSRLRSSMIADVTNIASPLHAPRLDRPIRGIANIDRPEMDGLWGAAD